MAILYRTTEFKSANTFAMAIWHPTAKFNSRQYFQLYGIIVLYLGVDLQGVVGIRDRAAHDYLLLWTETEPSSSCMAPWPCWLGTWSDSLSCGDGVIEDTERKGLIN